MEFILVLIGGYLLIHVALLFFQRDLIYFPPQSISESDRASLKDFKFVEVHTEDDLTLKAYFKAPQSSHKPILIFFHGNGSDPAWESYKTFPMREKGYGVLMATYRGYAGNPGSPSEAGLFRDGEAYIAWIKQAYPDAPLIVYGQSLGSGVAVEMASRYQMAAVVLEVPFFSALSVASRLYSYIVGMDFLMKDQFRNDLKIGKIKAPILFLLSGNDEVVSLQSGLDLFEVANAPKTKIVLEHAGHTNIYNYGAGDALAAFLEKEIK